MPADGMEVSGRSTSGRKLDAETPGWLIVMDLLISMTWCGVLGVFALVFILWPVPETIGRQMQDGPIEDWVRAGLPRAATCIGLVCGFFVLHSGAVRFLCDDRRARRFLLIVRGALTAFVLFVVLGAFVQFLVDRPVF